MSITERLMGQGAFNLTLKPDTPTSILDAIEFAGHIVVTDQEIDHQGLSDADIRAASRYVGVVVYRPIRDSQMSVKGRSLAWWLGDGQGRGLVLRGSDKQEWTNEDFDDCISDVLGVTQSPISAGSLETPAGTLTMTIDMMTQRRAIEEVCAAFGAEYRVNPDWSLDAGASGYLFQDPPLVTAVRKFGGPDPNTDGLLISRLSSDEDIEEWIATAIVAGQGTGDTLVYEEDTIGSNPYKNPQGSAFKREMLFNEPVLTAANALTRAEELSAFYGENRKIVTLNLDEFDTTNGKFEVGDLIYVWDPLHKLYDDSNELAFRGQTLNPIAIRVVGRTWGVTSGMGVYFRDDTGAYTDLSQYVSPENSRTTIEVGSTMRNLVNNRSESLEARITTDPDGNDVIGPDTPAHTSTPWATSTYTDGEGARKSRIVATWAEPLNTDASAVTDGSHYTIRYRVQGTTDYSYMQIDWGNLALAIDGLSPGITYEIGVSASDVNGNTSAFSSDETVVAAAQTGVPSQPAVPTVAGNVLNIQVEHDLTKQGGGALEDDLDHLIVYGSTSSGFTPSNANKLGTINANKSFIDLGIDVIASFEFEDTTTRYIKVTAVNKAGGESPASSQTTVSANLIDTQHIDNLAVTTAKIGNLQVTEAKIGNLEVTNAKINDLNVSKLTAGTISGETIILSDSSSSVIKSGDYSAGSAGWQIKGNGDAEFNNVTVRGDIVSSNWGGADPANLATAPDTSGTPAGFYLDASAGAAQFEGPVWLGGDLRMREGGVFSTGEDGDTRMEISGETSQYSSVTEDYYAYTGASVVRILQQRTQYTSFSSTREWTFFPDSLGNDHQVEFRSNSGGVYINATAAGTGELAHLSLIDDGESIYIYSDGSVYRGASKAAGFTSGLDFTIYGDAIGFNTGTETTSYIQHSAGSNYFRMVNEGSEGLRLTHNGSQSTLALYGTVASVVSKVEGGHLYFRNEVANQDVYIGTHNGSANKIRIRLTGDGNDMIFYDHDGLEQGRFSGAQATSQLRMYDDGSATQPSFSWRNQTNSGMYWVESTKRIMFSNQGTAICMVASSSFVPATDNTRNLGVSGIRWVDVWAVDTSINSSDEREKKFIKTIDGETASALVDAIDPISFIRKKRKRKHWGFGAFQIRDALESLDIKPESQAVWVDPMMEENPETEVDEDTPKAIRAGELLPVAWREIQSLRKRVAELEEAAIKEAA